MGHKLLSLTAIAAVSFGAFGAYFDPPDLRLEQELFRRYQNRTGIAEVPALAKDGYIESYRIQSGETLWSLSQTLYGDGHYWPRVWAQNRSITNPHLIRPGHTLQFILGSEEDTPSFRVTEADDSGVELASSANANPLIEIPPPEIPPRPILKIPKSFPQWQSVYKQLPVQITDDRGLLKQRRGIAGKAFVTAYVQESPLEGVGKFLETDVEASLPIVNQYVYVRLESGKGQAGQKMLIVRDEGKIQRMNKQVERVDAHLISIAGELELSEAVKGEGVEGEDVFRALITKVTSLTRGGYQLIPGEIEIMDLTYNGTPGMASAQIFGNGRHTASALYSPGDLVFINKGSSAGIEPGQIFDVFADRILRKDETPVQYSPAASGSVKIVRVTPNLSTAVILGARDGIQPGDIIRQVTSRREDREILEFREGDRSKDRDESDVESDLDADDGMGGGLESDEDMDLEEEL